MIKVFRAEKNKHVLSAEQSGISCLCVAVGYNRAVIKQEEIAMVSQRLNHTIDLCEANPLYKSSRNEHTAQTSIKHKTPSLGDSTLLSHRFRILSKPTRFSLARPCADLF